MLNWCWSPAEKTGLGRVFLRDVTILSQNVQNKIRMYNNKIKLTQNIERFQNKADANIMSIINICKNISSIQISEIVHSNKDLIK